DPAGCSWEFAGTAGSGCLRGVVDVRVEDLVGRCGWNDFVDVACVVVVDGGWGARRCGGEWCVHFLHVGTVGPVFNAQLARRQYQQNRARQRRVDLVHRAREAYIYPALPRSVPCIPSSVNFPGVVIAFRWVFDSDPASRRFLRWGRGTPYRSSLFPFELA